MAAKAKTKTNGELKWVGKRPVRPDGVDKVTGRAKFGADFSVPGMIVGKVLRSPHAHARIKSIDTSKAAALAGVKAVVTSDDFAEMPSEAIAAGEMSINFRDLAHNIVANDKVLYDGHAVAAVAATSASIARQALKLIKVDYEVLPHVTDVVAAMAPDAPILHDHMRTSGMEDAPDKPTNVAARVEVTLGDVEKGFAAADVIIERAFKTQAVHQGYIEPHACVASVAEDGQTDIWCSTQGHHVVRTFCARLNGIDESRMRVTRVGDRRWLRRQDDRLSGAAGDCAVAQGRPSGEAGHDPRGGIPRHRPDLGRPCLGQGRRDQ